MGITRECPVTDIISRNNKDWSGDRVLKVYVVADVIKVSSEGPNGFVADINRYADLDGRLRAWAGLLLAGTDGPAGKVAHYQCTD